MAGFVVTIKSEDAAYVARELAAMPEKIPKAMSAAINRVTGKVKTTILKELKKATTLKTQRIAQDVSIRKSSPSNLKATVTFYGRGIGGIQFKNTVSQTSGVTVQPLRGGPVQRYAHGFRGIGAAGNKHLWIRDKKQGGKYRVGKRAHHKPNIGRLMERIRPIYGPTLKTVYTQKPEIEAAANKVVEDELSEALRSQVDRFLGRSKQMRPIS